ncbi:MAG: amidohydrolase family protein [Acetobacteraceae bacterium]|nr:amidohydrolase family protein [Acetobacteraceae bacterium]
MLLITGARVLSPDAAEAPRADILIEHERIAAVLAPGEGPADAPRHDASNRLVIPGLINAHTHGHGGLGKGLGDTWDLALLLAHAPWLNGGRGAEEKRLSTLLAAVENLKKGATGGFDMTAEFPGPTPDGLDAMAEAYETVGLRMVLAPMVADLTFFEATPGLLDALPAEHRARAAALRMPPAAETLAAIARVAASWPHRGVALGIAPTIPLHGTDAFLRGCRELAEHFGLPMQTHVAEARYQAAGGAERYGRSLLAEMDRLGCVGPWFSVAHGVWLTDADLDLLAARGGGLAHNPGANMRLASGVAPVRKALARGIRVGIGTDGSSSSDNQNMFEAMRLAAFASRLWEDAAEQEWLGAAETVRLATAGSASLFGMEAGVIEAGRHADLVFLDTTHINWVPFNDAANQLVFTEDGSAVRDVMVGGAWKLRDGVVVGLDEAKLASEAQEAALRLLALNAPLRRWCESVAPHIACHCRALARGWRGARRLVAEAP